MLTCLCLCVTLSHASRYQGGFHQAIEAKEGVPVKADSHPTASITFQVFFMFYCKLAGMTGTASSAAAEFYETYRLKVRPFWWCG